MMLTWLFNPISIFVLISSCMVCLSEASKWNWRNCDSQHESTNQRSCAHTCGVHIVCMARDWYALFFHKYNMLNAYADQIHARSICLVNMNNWILIFWFLIWFSTDILHSVLGLPSECSHNNVIRSCTLSFSCWIQGGRHAEGCGENKWLFSCCIPEAGMEFNSIAHNNGPAKPSYFENDLPPPPPPARFNSMAKIKKQMLQTPPIKQNMLRRRMDDDGMVVLKLIVFFSIFCD